MATSHWTTELEKILEERKEHGNQVSHGVEKTKVIEHTFSISL